MEDKTPSRARKGKRPAPDKMASPQDANPVTGGTRPLQTVSAPRSNYPARQMLRKLVQGESPPTAPMSLVDRLAGSPYANPTIQVGGVDANARKTLDFALNLAESMFRYGAGALEVETSIIAVTASLGLRNVEVDITNQSVVINYAPRDRTPITVMRVVRSWTNNYAGLSLVHQLVTEIIDGDMGRGEAANRLSEITTRPKPYAKWMVTAAVGIFGAVIVAIIGGGMTASAVAFGSTILVSLMTRQLGKWRVPEFFTTAAGSAIVTFIALVCWWANMPISPGLVIAGGILLLLPSGRLVSAVQDAINGYPVTAAGRLLSAFLTFGAVVAGISVGLVAGVLLGLPRLDVTTDSSPVYNFWLVTLLVLVAGSMIALIEQSKVSLLLPTGLVAVLGYFVFTLAMTVGIGSRLAPAIAAVVIGFAARIVALRLQSPQLVVAVPAVLYLLPGLLIFRAMYVFTIESTGSLNGPLGIFNALTVILAIAGGVVLGDNLANPITRGLGANERRRGRRR